MSIISEARLSDSPYIETIARGYTASDGSTCRPAESNWHMVLRSFNGNTDLLFVGPLPTAGIISYLEGVELLWIKFQLGTFLPHLPMKKFLNRETSLPAASPRSFWLAGSTWQFPSFDNVETFVKRLAHAEVLVRDPDVSAALHSHPQDIPSRTLRHRFRQATGLPHSSIRQIQRAQHAWTLLQQGLSISDTVYEAGYFDQPHLTRSLKHFVGSTPAQLRCTKNSQ